MEKRTGRRLRFRFIGLLRIGSFLFLFSLFPFMLGAQQEEDESLNLLVETFPANPVTGSAWTVTIMVDHPVSQEVLVRPPDFPPSLILERVRSIVRTYSPPNAVEDEESSRWTAVEYLFTPQSSGIFSLEPFEVSAGIKHNQTRTISVQIRAPVQVQRQANPVFRWQGIPSSMTTGDIVELTLILSDWDASRPVPRNLFRGRIPENCIIEEMPFIGPGEDNLILYPVRIIPLEKGNFILNSLVIQHEGQRLEIPRISFSVVEAGSLSDSGASLSRVPDQLTDQTKESAFSPEDNSSFSAASLFQTSINRPSDKRVFPLFQKEYEKVVSEAALLWEKGSFAQALALVRMNERDRVFGSSLAPLRRNMEDELGLASSIDEKRSLLNVPLVVSVLLVIFALIALHVTSRVKKGFIHRGVMVLGGAAVLFLLITFAGFLRDSFTGSVSVPAAMSSSRPEMSGSEGCAILLSTPVYRVPDFSGVVVFHFDEGQAVRIRSSPGVWVHVESADGRSGWVPCESVIPY